LLQQQRLGPQDLVPERVEDYLVHRRASGQVRRLSPRGLVPLLAYLQSLGVVSAPVSVAPATPFAQLVEEFSTHLRVERGLAERTIAFHLRTATTFLHRSMPDTTGNVVFEQLTGADVAAFVLAEAPRLSVGSLNNTVTALRALLRFLHQRGYTPGSLAVAVPRAANRETGPSLKPVLTGEEVAGLLASCDRRTTLGRRDYAILHLLARLGLRAHEVAALLLEDVDWRAGEIVVAGKSGTRERLPLPGDVGEALAAYCRRGRPRGEDRNLFLRVHAPHCGLSSSGVSSVVVRACRRTGLVPVGAHRLRHTAASALRRAGAPMSEISQLLRHRRVVTTVRYVQEDLDKLTALARPWPGGGA
jgi:integrase/recombinase XerD